MPQVAPLLSVRASALPLDCEANAPHTLSSHPCVAHLCRSPNLLPCDVGPIASANRSGKHAACVPAVTTQSHDAPDTRSVRGRSAPHHLRACQKIQAEGKGGRGVGKASKAHPNDTREQAHMHMQAMRDHTEAWRRHTRHDRPPSACRPDRARRSASCVEHRPIAPMWGHYRRARHSLRAASIDHRRLHRPRPSWPSLIAAVGNHRRRRINPPSPTDL